MAEKATLIFEAVTGDLVTADERLEKLNKTGARTEGVAKRTAKGFSAVNGATQQLGTSFRRNNHTLQNTAFQLQDIVVQLEQGTSVSRTLGQQLPQLLGGFGAMGAVAGVVAGLGFALGGVLVNSLTESADAAGDLEKALEDLDSVISITDAGVIELSDSFKKLDGVAFQAGLKEAITDAKDAIRAARLEAGNLAEALSPNELGGRFDQTALRATILRNQFLAGEITLQAFAEGLDAVSVKGGALTKEFRDLRDAVRSQAESSAEAFTLLENLRRIEEGSIVTVNEHQESIDRLVFNLQAQASAANDAGNSTIFYRAQQLGATEAELLRIQSLQGVIEKQKELAAATLEAERIAAAEAASENARETAFQNRLFRTEDFLRSENQAYMDAYNERVSIIEAGVEKELLTEEEAAKLRAANDAKLNSDRLSEAASFLGDLSSLASSESREAFEISKAASIAQAVLKGYESALSAYAFGTSIGGPIVGGIFAGLSAAATGTLVGQIAASSPPGRAQGGQVRPGQTYRVGEFGPETLTMGSNGGTIIPSAANDSGPVEVVNNIQIIGGNENAQVTTNTTQRGDRKFVQDVVVDLMRNQSSPARQALQQTSNVIPRGTR
jgi:hypothetical protein